MLALLVGAPRGLAAGAHALAAPPRSNSGSRHTQPLASGLHPRPLPAMLFAASACPNRPLPRRWPRPDRPSGAPRRRRRRHRRAPRRGHGCARSMRLRRFCTALIAPLSASRRYSGPPAAARPTCRADPGPSAPHPQDGTLGTQHQNLQHGWLRRIHRPRFWGPATHLNPQHPSARAANRRPAPRAPRAARPRPPWRPRPAAAAPAEC
ncbi:MAG: hypothetical protein J3K34DRAFT_433100 [Monoraphidium minutum]|nr:MAG: hypothetical protein J3K34DRAFT_433100 [Monoraphidium minutum]